MYKKSLYSLCVGIFPLLLCTGLVYSVLPLYISRELGASASQLGLVYMAGASSGALFAPMLGKLSDRVGKRPVLLFAMGGFTLAFFSYSLLRNLPQAFLVQAVEGTSWAALGATIPALVADIVPAGERGWAMGVYERTWSFGWIGGPLIGGFLADNVGFRITFVAGAFLVTLSIAGLILAMRRLQWS